MDIQKNVEGKRYKIIPAISVVIPTKGRPQLLKRALDSVFKQTMTDFEVLVVVDGPDEETESMLKTCEDFRLRVVVNPESLGGAEARNIGVRNSRGEWIAFLDDDDEWLPQKLETQLQAVKSSSYRYPIAFCRVIGRAPHGDYVWPRRGLKKNEPISNYLLVRNSLFQGEGLIQTTMIFAPRELLLEVPFTKGLKRHQEWDWLLRVSAYPGVCFVFCEDVLAIWYVEEKRSGISKQGDWKFSAQWIQQHRERVTKRAYAAFLMVLVSSIAKKDGDIRAFFWILKESMLRGRPAPIDLLLFIGIWCVPQRLRWFARKVMQGKKRGDPQYVQIVTQMEGGGAQRVAVLLAEELHKKGISCKLWFLYTKRDLYSSLPYVKSLYPHQPEKMVDIVQILWRLFINLLKTKPDTLVTHTHYANVIAQPIAWLLGIRKRIAVQHAPIDTYPKMAKVIDRLLGQFGIYSHVVAVSRAVYDSLSHYRATYLSRTKVILNGVSHVKPDLDLKEVRQRLGIPLDIPLLVNVGRLAPEKNQELLIRIMAELPKVHLLLVGEGELRFTLIRLAEELNVADRVHFVGEVPPNEVVEYLNAGDLFVFPSLYESMGLAMVEAMNLGLPIIASDLPAIREVTEVGQGVYAAILVPSEDVNGFAQAVKTVLADRELAKVLGERAKQKARVYRVSEMVDAYERLRGESHEGTFSGDHSGKLHCGHTSQPH